MSDSHPRCVLIGAQAGAAPPPPFTLTYHKDPTTMPTIDGVPSNPPVVTETTIVRKLGTRGKGYITVTTRSTGRHKIEVHNGEQQQSNASYGYTDLDDTNLLNLYNAIGAALGDPK